MPASPEDLIAFLEFLGVVTPTVEHPPLFTVENSRGLRGDIHGGRTKNLFVKDKKGRLFLLVVGEAAEVDLKRVHEQIGGRGASRSARRNISRRCGGSSPGGDAVRRDQRPRGPGQRRARRRVVGHSR